ncbi:hypothetical protein [Polyangium sp. 15x6]|uniref:hypothetical protein n=1 Tax=Polyangium sp. 15x6 TaxID=3042687 RepID=UPI00249B2653|nr:hypothetical protein [Polyangium sp. 15x6]MDI3291529.1 hypothetical protein [Polyangium sp. 15x6]
MVEATGDPWEIYDAALPFAGATYKFGPQRVRMAVVGLGGGALLVVSPGTDLSEAHWERLSRWGTPRFLLAPNHFHHAGLAAWKARFPDAKVVAHPRAQALLRIKRRGIPIEDLSLLEAALPDGIRVFSPPMAKQGETWVSVKTNEGAAWFVTDGILNEERLPRGLLGLFLRVAGFRPGLMTNPFFKRFFLEDKAAYKAWVRAELDRDRPVLFVPSHGAPLRGADVGERLRAATDAA